MASTVKGQHIISDESRRTEVVTVQWPGQRLFTVIKRATLTGSLTECKWPLERATSDQNTDISFDSNPYYLTQFHFICLLIQFNTICHWSNTGRFFPIQCHREVLKRGFEAGIFTIKVRQSSTDLQGFSKLNIHFFHEIIKLTFPVLP